MTQLRFLPSFDFEKMLEETRVTRERLNEVSLFREANLSDLSLSRLSELLLRRSCHVGESLVHQGELAMSLYLVTSGEFSLTSKADLQSQPQLIGVVLQDEIYGANFLLEPSVTDCTFTARTKSEVLVFDGAAYDQFAKEFPESAFKLQAVLARRMLAELKKARNHSRLLIEALKSVG